MASCNFIEMAGKRFGRYTVLKKSEKRTSDGLVFWVARCECGNIKSVNGSFLRRGMVKSCGCLQREVTIKRLLKHGRSGPNDPTYRTWMAMKSRCNNRNNAWYKNYGGRGIRVCKDWSDSFQKFFDHIGERPGANFSIERIDNNKGYFPGNVRWATRLEQARNMRTVKTATHNGQTKTVYEWEKISGVKGVLIRYRIIHGWDHARAIFTPKDERFSRHRKRLNFAFGAQEPEIFVGRV